MSVEPAFDDFIGSRGDRCCKALFEEADVTIGEGCRLFDQSKRSDEGLRHALLADFEVPARALGLGAPIAVVLHVDRSERIGFATCRSFGLAQGTSLLRHARSPVDGAQLGGILPCFACDRMTYGVDGGIT